MERREIKKKLYEMGASTVLLEMPAVMERIYNYYSSYTEEEFVNELTINGKGEIIFSKDDKKIREFKEIEDGEAIFNNYELDGIEMDGKYIIDKYGMDRDFTDLSDPLFERTCSVTRKNEGSIEVNGKESFVKDEGDPILNYYNYTVLKTKASRSIGWKANKDFLTKYYPITKEWFAIREGILENDENEEIGNKEANSEIENLKNRLKTMQNNYDKLKAENEDLRKENTYLKDKQNKTQSMLKKALKVCEDVKMSPLGKIFFGRKLKQLPESPDEEGR